MGKVNDKELALARVYGGSMLELAAAQDRADGLLAELGDLLALLDGNARFEEFLSSPMVDVSARSATLEKVFRGKVSDLLLDSLQVLNRKERLPLLRAITEAYRLAHQELRGLVDVQVLTAVPLPDKMREKLRDAAARFTGRQAQLVESVDESILGGMILRIGDTKFDTSVSAKLRKLGGCLHERAAQEIHGGRGYVTAG